MFAVKNWISGAHLPNEGPAVPHDDINISELKRWGADKKAITRLHARKMSIGYASVKNKQTEYGKDYDKKLRQWSKEVFEDSVKEEELKSQVEDLRHVRNDANAGFSAAIAEKALQYAENALDKHRKESNPSYRVGGDNADFKEKARFKTTKKNTRDHHHFQMFAVKNRVSGAHLPKEGPAVPHDEINISELLPTVEDNQALRHTWCVLIGRVISKYLPEMKWMENHLPSLAHKHMKEAKTKSELVS